ncbi:MAG: aminotransferase, partial [Burkholderiaceae bacterium]|nr:aminotransferase [Burkholderiaceae bacterium]
AEAATAALNALASSWPVGAHGVAMLSTWAAPASQRWLAACLPVLCSWKAQQQALCEALGWVVVPGSLANYFCAQWSPAEAPHHGATTLQHLRRHGIKLRDCTSFGLPGVVRMGVLPPAAQRALRRAWLQR